MVDADNSTFVLQARTVLAPGNLSIATVFSAGAAKELNTSKVEVRAKSQGKTTLALCFISYYSLCPTFLTFDNVTGIQYKFSRKQKQQTNKKKNTRQPRCDFCTK